MAMAMPPFDYLSCLPCFAFLATYDGQEKGYTDIKDVHFVNLPKIEFR